MSTIDRRGFLTLGAASVLGARFARAASAAEKAAPPTEVKTGGIRLISVDGKYKVWTKRVGHGPIKILTLHGGPGWIVGRYDEMNPADIEEMGRRIRAPALGFAKKGATSACTTISRLIFAT
ncbi:MAG TPA: hypothetical protein VGL03_15540 [Thermoanaerobaculia bacterium]|jgi:hypothetical protein